MMNSRIYLIIWTVVLIPLLVGCSSASNPDVDPTWTPNPPPYEPIKPTPHETAIPAKSTGSDIDLEVSSLISSIPKYNRNDWNHWVDLDGDCQNERHEVLIDESLIEVTFKDDNKCQVLSGKWLDPYTGQEIYEATKLDIDHMVPLKNAHDSGGWQWNASEKKEFAN